MLQFITEYNLFQPSALLAESSDTEKKDFLETYWDAPVAKVGQVGAAGWGAWLESRGEGEPEPKTSNRGERRGLK